MTRYIAVTNFLYQKFLKSNFFPLEPSKIKFLKNSILRFVHYYVKATVFTLELI